MKGNCRYFHRLVYEGIIPYSTMEDKLIDGLYFLKMEKRQQKKKSILFSQI